LIGIAAAGKSKCFFDALKVGCKVEKLQLAKKERIEKALIMSMIITWRVMYLIPFSVFIFRFGIRI